MATIPADGATESGKESGARTGPRHAAGILVLVTAATFANTLPNAFHLDDFYRLVENPAVRVVSPWWRHFVDVHTMATLPTITNYRPLLPLTLSLNYAVGGLNPAGYHVVNIALQALAAVLVYLLFIELLEQGSPVRRPLQPWVALSAAAVFAVHPVSGIPVNYVTARDLLLMQVFMTGSLLAYVRMRRSGSDTIGGWVAVLALYLLALLSKTGVVVLSGLVAAYEVVVRRESPLSPGPWVRASPFLVLAIAFFAYVSLVLNHSEIDVVRSNEYTPIIYGATQLKLHLFHYMRNFVWPFPIRQGPEVAPIGPMHPAAWAGAMFVLSTFSAAWLARRTLPVITFCVLSYWALLVPEASIFPLWAIATDYRPYAASPFLYLSIAVISSHCISSYRALRVAAILAVIWSAGTSAYLNTTWRTEQSLWRHSVDHGGSALAYLNLGMSHRDPGIKASFLREAIHKAPNYILAHMNLGLALIDSGRRSEGLTECLTAVSIDPYRAQTRYWMGKAYEKLGRPDEQAREAAIAARLEPSNVEYAYYAGRSAQARGDMKGARMFLERILHRDPPYKDAAALYAKTLESLRPGPAD
ncbi:MAG: tetratricopeptide repeat protein [Candidatus Deferrimicrobiaceae bacterium]